MLTKGIQVSDIVSAVTVDLQDTAQERWESSQIISFINAGIRAMGKKRIFRRVDYQRVVAGKALYTTFAECAGIIEVQYDRQKIRAVMDSDLHGDWRSLTGAPDRYIARKGSVRLYTIPSAGGDAFTLNTPDITEAEGGSINGDEYSAALNGTTVVHFLEGDGVCPNADTATNNLRIEYSFYPRPVDGSTYVPSKYVTALQLYSLWRCLSLSEAKEEVARAQVIGPEWRNELAELVTEAQPRALADGTRYAGFKA